MIAHAAPPPPVLAMPAVSFGQVAVRLGPGTLRIEVQSDGRITHRRRVPPGPRRVAVPVPPGVHPVRVKAIGRGGARWSATVRVRALPAASRRAGRIPGFVDRRLQGEVEAVLARVPAVSGAYVQHLVTGCGAAVNADAQFPAASTLKAAILVEAVRRGRARDLASLLDRMAIDSDDEAANAVLAAIGGGSGDAGAAAVTDTLHDLGLTRSLVRRPYLIEEDARRPLGISTTTAPALHTNLITTPYELARLMVAIHRGAIGAGGIARIGVAPSAARAEVLARLIDTRDHTKLVAGVPPSVTVAHKSGYTEEVKHDAGILYLRRGPVVVSVMTWIASGVGDAAGGPAIAAIAAAARHRLGRGGSCDGLPLPSGRAAR